MSSLREMKIVPIQANSTLLSEAEIKKLSAELAHWDVIQVDGEKRLQREYPFKDFSQALSFTVQVGGIAEAENHHPSILTEWGSVTVTWWTHKVKGLHQNDFIMAARTDHLYEQRQT